MSTLEQADLYEERYVGFVDILGFENLVREADQDTTRRLAIIKALTMVNEAPPPEESVPDLRAQIFSDSLIISASRTPKGLWHLLMSLKALTWNLLQESILVRGGISLGGIHHDNQIVFGMGVISAYRLETNVARYPRIVLSRAVAEEANKLATARTSDGLNSVNLQRDKDGVMFLHYLDTLALLNRQAPKELAEWEISFLRNGKKIFNFIQNVLNVTLDEPSVYEKYRWLADYWNKYVGIEKATYNINGVSYQLGYLNLAGENS